MYGVALEKLALWVVLHPANADYPSARLHRHCAFPLIVWPGARGEWVLKRSEKVVVNCRELGREQMS